MSDATDPNADHPSRSHPAGADPSRTDPSRTDPSGAAKLAVLKSLYGEELSDDERTLSARFLATDEGRAFRSSNEETLALLRCLDRPAASTPPEGMVTRFERTIRGTARETRLRFGRFCLGVFGIFSLGLLLPLVFPKPGRPMNSSAWGELAIVLGGGAALFCWAVWVHNRRLERETDVIGFMLLSEGRARHSRWRHVILFTLIALLTTHAAERSYGWPTTLIATAVVGGVMLLMKHLLRSSLRTTRMRQDPELWTWWYEGDVPGDGGVAG